MPEARVVLADSGHPGEDGFAAVHVLRRGLPEEEVDEGSELEGTDKVGVVELSRVVLHGAQRATEDDGVHSLEIG